MKLRLGEEIYKKYRNTYIRIKVAANAPWQIFYINRFAYEDGDWPPRRHAMELEGELYKQDHVDKGAHCTLNLKDYILDLSIPPLGYINDLTNGFAIYAVQRNLKQWKRGVCDNTVTHWLNYGNFNLYIFKKTVQSKITGIKPLILGTRVYNPKLMSFDEAVQTVLKGDMITAAFERNFAVGLNTLVKNRIVVYYKTHVIGVVDKRPKADDYFIRLPEAGLHLIEEVSQFAHVEVG